MQRFCKIAHLCNWLYTSESVLFENIFAILQLSYNETKHDLFKITKVRDNKNHASSIQP